LSVVDNGVGMDREDLVSGLGTIANSGTRRFLQDLKDREEDASPELIGQFGVGFYSSFIVADRVEVFTRRAGLAVDEGVHWTSEGDGEFTVETIERPDRGTEVRLHLRDDATEFADELRLRNLIRKYSDHIAFPVVMKAPQPPAGEDGETPEAPEDETVNTAKALWTRPRTEVSDEEYQEFYRHVSHDFQDALLWSHNKVEGKREYTSLLFIPKQPPYDLWNRESPRGLKLYVQRVFIMDDAEQFLPLYLRFVRGVVDSNDLSLNVSREILQQDATVEAIRSALTKRVLDLLEKLSRDDAEQYQSFWKEFGRAIKEGPAEDFANKDKIAGLLRFATTQTGKADQDQSLADYVSRKQDGQDKIYFVTADSFKAASSSPQLEVFRKRGIEVLLLSDSIDEWLMGQLREFDGMEFRDVRRGELDLGDTDAESEDKDKEKDDGEHKVFLDRLREQLQIEVEDVRVTDRLTDSPACLAIGEYDMGAQMRRIMEASGQQLPESKPVFEINIEHPLIRRLESEADEQRFGDLAGVLLDQARLAEGQQLEDPGSYAQRVNRLLLELSA
ncbi:MAG: molecular chaperone HtpG, partial [Gammaproteobacteria bacterium]|nr:molecular chaperone HtpG [Gammaproteobacteria bacterium]